MWLLVQHVTVLKPKIRTVSTSVAPCDPSATTQILTVCCMHTEHQSDVSGLTAATGQ